MISHTRAHAGLDLLEPISIVPEGRQSHDSFDGRRVDADDVERSFMRNPDSPDSENVDETQRHGSDHSAEADVLVLGSDIVAPRHLLQPGSNLSGNRGAQNPRGIVELPEVEGEERILGLQDEGDDGEEDFRQVIQRARSERERRRADTMDMGTA